MKVAGMAIYSYDHGVVERNHIYSLDSHGKALEIVIIINFYYYEYYMFYIQFWTIMFTVDY